MKPAVWIFETSSPGLYVAYDVRLLITVCVCVCVCVRVCVCVLGWGSGFGLERLAIFFLLVRILKPHTSIWNPLYGSYETSRTVLYVANDGS